jgi:hypothetical protein
MISYYKKVWTWTVIVSFILLFYTFSFAQNIHNESVRNFTQGTQNLRVSYKIKTINQTTSTTGISAQYIYINNWQFAGIVLLAQNENGYLELNRNYGSSLTEINVKLGTNENLTGLYFADNESFLADNADAYQVNQSNNQVVWRKNAYIYTKDKNTLKAMVQTAILNDLLINMNLAVTAMSATSLEISSGYVFF